MSDWLAHHGVKGMKWGVRRYQPYGEGGYNPDGRPHMKRMSKRQAKREFKKSFEADRRRFVDEDKEYKELRNRVDAYDKKRLKEHPGYESGDDYDENWRNLKGNDSKTKAIRQYSKDVENWESVESKAYKHAADNLMEKYGGRSWQEAYKANKSAIKKGRATAEKDDELRRKKKSLGIR